MKPENPEASLHAEFAFGMDLAVSLNSRSNSDRLTQLFEELRDPLYRYLLLITRDGRDSEDLVQETFVRLLGQLKSGKPIGNLRAWLFRTGHNLALNRLRSDRKAESLTEDHVSRDAEQRLASAVPSPEVLFLRKERQDELGCVIAKLPAQQRYCLFLRREGLRYREIAAVLGMGETTVVDHIRRAIERIEQELHDR